MSLIQVLYVVLKWEFLHYTCFFNISAIFNYRLLTILHSQNKCKIVSFVSLQKLHCWISFNLHLNRRELVLKILCNILYWKTVNCTVNWLFFVQLKGILYIRSQFTISVFNSSFHLSCCFVGGSKWFNKIFL
jgi:hypothetical protein